MSPTASLLSLLGPVRTQEKASEKYKVKRLFHVWHQGAASFSSACDEERKWHGVCEPSAAPNSPGAPTASRKNKDSTWPQATRHHLCHSCQGFNTQNREVLKPGFESKSMPCKETHSRRTCLGDRRPRVKGRLRYQKWAQAHSCACRAPGVHWCWGY